MRIFKIILLLAILSSSFTLKAQQTYLSEAFGLVYKYTVADCSLELLVDIERPLFDIAFHPNGNLYGLSNNNIIFEIDTITGNTTDIYTFNSTSSTNSMAIDGKGEIFIAGTQLESYQIETAERKNYGLLPAPAAGDLLFYKGKLLAALSNFVVVEVNISSPEDSETVIYDSSLYGLWGMFSFGSDCDDIRAFGVSGDGSTIYELNFSTENIEMVCDIPFEATGAAGSADHFAPEVFSVDVVSSECDMPTGSIELNLAGGLAPFQTYLNNVSNNGSFSFNDLTSGEYEIYVLDSRECDVSITVNVLQGECPIYFPNVFSPNNDGYNDLFTPEKHPNFNGSIISYSIFDRWGNQIKYDNSPDWEDLTWNGKYNDQLLGPQVFVYLLEIKANDGVVRKYQGDVSIIR